MKPITVVTGASSGIGEVFARKLAARGYDLILVARRAERLAQVAASLPVETEVVAADLTVPEDLARVEEKLRMCGRLGLLVNNAGFGTLGRFWEAELAGQERMHRLHVTATMRLTHAALGNLAPRETGAVINVSSVAAFSQSEGNVSYCATKARMNSFTEGLAIELRRMGSPVRVQALCPGFTVTEFHETLGMDRRQIPKFLWMSPESIVDASLRGLDRGTVIVIPGWKYKATVALLRHVPSALRRRMVRPGKDRRV